MGQTVNGDGTEWMQPKLERGDGRGDEWEEKREEEEVVVVTDVSIATVGRHRRCFVVRCM